MTNIINNLSRAVVIDEGKILLAKFIEAGFYFLPGGHVEYNESMKSCLVREFEEETGIKNLAVGDLITVYEQSFDTENLPYHEINYIFSAKLNKHDVNVQSKESHITFEWVELNKLSTINFLPNKLKDIIIDFNNGLDTKNFYSEM